MLLGNPRLPEEFEHVGAVHTRRQRSNVRQMVDVRHFVERAKFIETRQLRRSLESIENQQRIERQGTRYIDRPLRGTIIQTDHGHNENITLLDQFHNQGRHFEKLYESIEKTTVQPTSSYETFHFADHDTTFVFEKKSKIQIRTEIRGFETVDVEQKQQRVLLEQSQEQFNFCHFKIIGSRGRWNQIDRSQRWNIERQ